MYQSQIEHVVAQARQDPNFTTTLINASFGGAVIEGFIHSSLADYATDRPSGGTKRIDALSNSLRTVVVDAKLIGSYKKLRLRQLQKTMSCLTPVVAGLDGRGQSMQGTKSFLNMERKLLKSMEKMPLLTAHAQATSLRLRSNTYDSAEAVDGLKADFYRCILTFIQSWKSALKNQNDEKT